MRCAAFYAGLLSVILSRLALRYRQGVNCQAIASSGISNMLFAVWLVVLYVLTHWRVMFVAGCLCLTVYCSIVKITFGETAEYLFSPTVTSPLAFSLSTEPVGASFDAVIVTSVSF